jgi:hypothetical protein
MRGVLMLMVLKKNLEYFHALRIWDVGSIPKLMFITVI